MSEEIEKIIKLSIENFDDNFELNGSAFEELISMGELIDRLSIVNFKLFRLKDEVMNNDDKEFKAWASVEDVKLVKERARLKKCIDLKLLNMISRVIQGDETGGFVPEVKKYGSSPT